MVRGNQAAYQKAKRAALQNNDLIGVATLVPQTNFPETPSYTEGETLKAKSEGFQEDRMGWFHKEGLLFLPGNLQWKLVNSLHATTYLGEKVIQKLIERSFRGTGLQMTIRQVVSFCPTCQLNNSQGAQRPQLAQPIQRRGTYPGEDWQMDFTQMPVSPGYKYLLVMIDTFTGWIEGFPIGTEKAEEVVKALLHEIFLRFGLPSSVAARQASLSITNSRSSLRLTSIESVMPSSHLILCRSLLLLSPIPPSIRVFSNESTLRMR